MSNEDSDSQDDHRCSSNSRGNCACGTNLLDQNEAREYRDPDEVHDADHKEQAHECPATSEAINPMPKAHSECTERSVAPIRHQESEWTTALRQASGFPMRKLIGTGRQ